LVSEILYKHQCTKHMFSVLDCMCGISLQESKTRLLFMLQIGISDVTPPPPSLLSSHHLRTPHRHYIPLESLHPSPLILSPHHIPLSNSSRIPLLRRRSYRNRLLYHHRSRVRSSILHLLTIHARRRLRVQYARAHLVAPLHVHILDVEGVDVAGEVAQKREQNVDEQVGAAAGDEEDTDGWDCRVRLVGEE
jgi:hypothetical protein